MHIEILVEEASAEAFLDVLLRRILANATFSIITFSGKDDLLKKLPDRLTGYAHWLPPNYRIIILLDRDATDCKKLKAHLNSIIADVGFTPRQQATARIAIEELEAWYFGDGAALHSAYPRVSLNLTNKAAYRDPDTIRGGTWEALERELQRCGYHKGGLAKIKAARDIGQYIDPARNRSQSFQSLIRLLQEFDILA